MTAVLDYTELNNSDSELLERSQLLQESQRETSLISTPEKGTREIEMDSPDRLLSSPEHQENNNRPETDNSNNSFINEINEDNMTMPSDVRTFSSLLFGITANVFNKMKVFFKYIDLYLFLQNIPMLLLWALRLIGYKLMIIYFVCSSFFIFHRFRVRCIRAYEDSSSGNGNSAGSNEENYPASEDQQSHSDILSSQNQAGASGDAPDHTAIELDAFDEFNEERLRNLYIGLRILSAMGVTREHERRSRSGPRGSRGIVLREQSHRGILANELGREHGHGHGQNSFQPILDRIFRDFSYSTSRQGHPPHGRSGSQRGLSEGQLNSLTSYKYCKSDILKPGESEEKQCIICFEDFENNQDVKSLPCIHTYHKLCIDKWLRSHNSCPVCKNKAI